MDPNLKDFIGSVGKMREHQKAYFSKRQANDLEQAKFYERRVDAHLKKFKSDNNSQTTLFNG